MEANKIAITDEALRRGAEEGMDGFLKVFIDKYLEVTGGVVNAETMPLLNGYRMDLDLISLIILLQKQCGSLERKNLPN